MADTSGDVFGGRNTYHCPNPMWGSNPETSGKVGAMLLGEEGDLKLHPFMDLHQKGDPSTGVVGDNRNTTFFKLQQDLEAQTKENDLLNKT